MARITNLVQYPKTTSARAVLNLTAGNAGWGGTGSRTTTMVADATAPSGGGYWTRIANSAAGTTASDNLGAPTSKMSATEGLPYSGLIYVRSNEPLVVAFQLMIVNTSGTEAGRITGPPVTLIPGQITPLTLSGIMPATATGFIPRVMSVDAVAYTSSCILDIDAALIEQSATLSRDYFDGDTPPFRYGPLAQIVTPTWSGTAGQSSSYFDYEEPWELGTQWDGAAARAFELGVDRGVLYNRAMVGVPWNGLVNVTEKLTNTELTRYYQDGSKYYTDQSKPEFSATIEAYTYPDIFETFSGKTQVVEGLYADEASFGLFHFSYRTKVGDAVYGPDKFYKIHLVYNAYAIPSDRSYGTVNESPSASTFSWDITTDAIAFTPGSNSTMTSHLIIDSRKISATKLKNLETILYGTSNISPRLPLPAEVRTILA